MAQKGFMDEVFAGIGNAVTDVRQRVVEEGWYGRVVTGNDSGPEIAVTVDATSPEPGMGGVGPAGTPDDPGKTAPQGPTPSMPPMAPPEPDRPDPEPDMGR